MGWYVTWCEFQHYFEGGRIKLNNGFSTQKEWSLDSIVPQGIFPEMQHFIHKQQQCFSLLDATETGISFSTVVHLAGQLKKTSHLFQTRQCFWSF